MPSAQYSSAQSFVCTVQSSTGLHERRQNGHHAYDYVGFFGHKVAQLNVKVTPSTLIIICNAFCLAIGCSADSGRILSTAKFFAY